MVSKSASVDGEGRDSGLWTTVGVGVGATGRGLRSWGRGQTGHAAHTGHTFALNAELAIADDDPTSRRKDANAKRSKIHVTWVFVIRARFLFTAKSGR